MIVGTFPDTNATRPAGQPPGETLVRYWCLDNAENDGADEGERDVRGHNAQLAQQRTREVHWDAPLVHNAARINDKASKTFPAKKVSAAVPPGISMLAPGSAAWLRTHEFNALKSL
ncbi:hypothetical protein [Bradyrhizobium genosp. P]|uniref:hypothetical protein n=1 Tax=Bradyrhizobium genosp. P TaxID=83641 RepID=UPI003CEC1AE8